MGVARNLCWGPDNRGAEDAEIETPKVLRGKGMGRAVLLPSRLEGLGERCKLPWRGPGQSHGRKRVLEYLELEKNTPDSHKFVIFDISAAYI